MRYPVAAYDCQGQPAVREAKQVKESTPARWEEYLNMPDGAHMWLMNYK